MDCLKEKTANLLFLAEVDWMVFEKRESSPKAIDFIILFDFLQLLEKIRKTTARI